MDTERSWPDKCHIPLEDVDELGKFVDGGGADEAAHLGEALCIGEEFTICVTLVGHGLKFDDLENLSILARALLEEEYAGAFVGEMKPDNDNKEDGRKAYQGDERQGKVDNALEKMFVHDLCGVMLRRGGSWQFCTIIPPCAMGGTRWEMMVKLSAPRRGRDE